MSWHFSSVCFFLLPCPAPPPTLPLHLRSFASPRHCPSFLQSHNFVARLLFTTCSCAQFASSKALIHWLCTVPQVPPKCWPMRANVTPCALLISSLCPFPSIKQSFILPNKWLSSTENQRRIFPQKPTIMYIIPSQLCLLLSNSSFLRVTRQTMHKSTGASVHKSSSLIPVYVLEPKSTFYLWSIGTKINHLSLEFLRFLSSYTLFHRQLKSGAIDIVL